MKADMVEMIFAESLSPAGKPTYINREHKWELPLTLGEHTSDDQTDHVVAEMKRTRLDPTSIPVL